MTAVATAIAELAAVDIAAIPEGAVGAELTELFRLAAQLEAQINRRLALFDARGGAAADGAVSTAAWLRRTCRLAPGAAHERVVVARQLTALPSTSADLAAEDITYRHAALIATATVELPEDDSEQAELILLEAARRCDPATLRKITTHLRCTVDPDGARSRDEDIHGRRRLFLSPILDGQFALDGALDAQGGATVLAALMALDSPIPDDDRTPAQRRADALVELARRALDGGDLPDTGGERPHLTVTIDLASLTGTRGVGELDWAAPVSGEVARRIACDAGVSRVITAGPSEPLDVGRRTRVVPPALRRALIVRDKGCRFPGCDRPPQWTDAHHLGRPTAGPPAPTTWCCSAEPTIGCCTRVAGCWPVT